MRCAAPSQAQEDACAPAARIGPTADALIYLDPTSPLTLQHQILGKLVDLIVPGSVPPGSRRPSTRGLAKQLGVSRNTVVIAYQQLLA